MTGYGRAQAQLGGRDILVEIKSVNSRFLEPNVRIARSYTYLEEELKALLKTRVSRGKTEIAVTVTLVDGKRADIRVNDEIVRGYLEAMRDFSGRLEQESGGILSMNDGYGNSDGSCVHMNWADMLGMPDIFRIEKPQEDEEEIRSSVLAVAGQALDNFVAMRETEGVKLRADVEQRLDMIAALLSKVEEEAPALT